MTQLDIMQCANEAKTAILKQAPDFTPKVALVLGSGLGNFAEQLNDAISIPYSSIPHFPDCSVKGHDGQLILGKIGETPVVCLKGRVHLYEGGDINVMRILIFTLKALGCELFLATNAAGSLNESVPPGSLVLIEDHINMQLTNPLIGLGKEYFGSTFLPLEQAYDIELRRTLEQHAAELDIKLDQGTYMSILGPCFETPAEIRAYRKLGADVIGMSTVPEVILARYCQMRVLAISVVTNFAVGMSSEEVNHENTLKYAKLAETNLTKLLNHFISHGH